MPKTYYCNDAESCCMDAGMDQGGRDVDAPMQFKKYDFVKMLDLATKEAAEDNRKLVDSFTSGTYGDDAGIIVPRSSALPQRLGQFRNEATGDSDRLAGFVSHIDAVRPGSIQIQNAVYQMTRSPAIPAHTMSPLVKDLFTAATVAYCHNKIPFKGALNAMFPEDKELQAMIEGFVVENVVPRPQDLTPGQRDSILAACLVSEEARGRDKRMYVADLGLLKMA
jgi:hypothetical protein